MYQGHVHVAFMLNILVVYSSKEVLDKLIIQKTHYCILDKLVTAFIRLDSDIDDVQVARIVLRFALAAVILAEE